VLDLSKIEAGRMTLNAGPFDLHRLLSDIQDMFTLRAEAKDLHLLFDQDESVPRYVRTDEVKLRQVLINLLNNAIKFTIEGGVAVRVKRVNEFDEWENSKTQKLLFEIEDSGPGIAPEEMDKVFEAFGQTETGRQSQEGTGLGLPISRKFVQLMDGDMQVKSEAGHGTLFTFSIQVHVVTESDMTSRTPARRVVGIESGQRAADGSDRYRILIVDDRWTNRRLVAKLLNPLGFELREEVNGQEAIDVWKTLKPHLIWMDMRMPVLDGYEATKRIKAEIHTSKSEIHTAIIALTASSLEEERAVVLEAGCDDYLRKPFREAELFELLNKHLGVRFVYEAGGPFKEDKQVAGSKKQVTVEEAVTPEALAELPVEWLAAIKQGAEEVNVEALSFAIAQIREQNPTLADALTRLAENFEYDEILALIQTNV
jgi:CheY-like chemotaxis protein